MSSCACVEGWDDCGNDDVSWEKTPKARKQWKCCECRREIKPGERYEYVKGVWDGSFDQYRTCRECAEIRKSLLCSWMYTALWDTLDDAWMPSVSWLGVNWTAIAKMTAPARNKVLDWLESYPWEDEDEDG